MTPAEIIDSLGLPGVARVDQRVPKKLLVEHGAPTGTDKRQINEAVEELTWDASLKPSTVGLTLYRDATREVLELAVLTLRLRPDTPKSRAARLVQLVHRAIPYPLLLITTGPPTAPPGLGLSLANKRWSQGEAGKTVLDGDVCAIDLSTLPTPVCQQLLPALALTARRHPDLYALYHGWLAALTAADAARLTRTFRLPATPEEAAERRAALLAVSALESRMAALRSLAAKERQTPRLVELNLELQQLHKQRAAHITTLGGSNSP